MIVEGHTGDPHPRRVTFKSYHKSTTSRVQKYALPQYQKIHRNSKGNSGELCRTAQLRACVHRCSKMEQFVGFASIVGGHVITGSVLPDALILYAIMVALKSILSKSIFGGRYTIFSDSPSAMMALKPMIRASTISQKVRKTVQKTFLYITLLGTRVCRCQEHCKGCQQYNTYSNSLYRYRETSVGCSERELCWKGVFIILRREIQLDVGIWKLLDNKKRLIETVLS